MYTVQDESHIVVHNKPPAEEEEIQEYGEVPQEEREQTVFERMNMRHIYIPPFMPENLNDWEPQTEPDVYLVFGVLQKYTEFRYCCGASKALLDKLGAKYEEAAKPDAILIEAITGRYLMAEWKKYSSDFQKNHDKNDVDVLVCWLDNENDKGKLPPRVLALQDIARLKAKIALEE